MANQTTLTVFVAIVALTFLAQAALMLFLYLSVRELPLKVESIRTDVKERLDPVVRSLTEILLNSRDPVQTITANLAEITRLLRERTGQIDAVVADLVDRSRLQVIRIDQLISGLADKIETTADRLRQQVLAPLEEVSAVIKGVKSGLEFLFSRRRVSRVTEATPDEQMFI